jgi:small subunit ribosomal protein S16
MSVVIRFARYGSKRNPIYRVVAADKKFARDGRFLEILGTYNPKNKASTLKKDRVEHWLNVGAQPSEVAGKLIKRECALSQ